jgi:hypothetical protein
MQPVSAAGKTKRSEHDCLSEIASQRSIAYARLGSARLGSTRRRSRSRCTKYPELRRVMALFRCDQSSLTAWRFIGCRVPVRRQRRPKVGVTISMHSMGSAQDSDGVIDPAFDVC